MILMILNLFISEKLLSAQERSELRLIIFRNNILSMPSNQYKLINVTIDKSCL